MNKYLILALVLILCGCGRPRTAGIYTGILEVTMEARVLEAMQGDPGFLQDYGSRHIEVLYGNGLTNYLGQATKYPGGHECTIQLHTSVVPSNAKKFRHVLFHELGHCFGLEHSGAPGDVMYQYYYEAKPADAAAYGRFNALMTDIRDM